MCCKEADRTRRATAKRSKVCVCVVCGGNGKYKSNRSRAGREGVKNYTNISVSDSCSIFLRTAFLKLESIGRDAYASSKFQDNAKNLFEKESSLQRHFPPEKSRCIYLNYEAPKRLLIF